MRSANSFTADPREQLHGSPVARRRLRARDEQFNCCCSSAHIRADPRSSGLFRSWHNSVTADQRQSLHGLPVARRRPRACNSHLIPCCSSANIRADPRQVVCFEAGTTAQPRISANNYTDHPWRDDGPAHATSNAIVAVHPRTFVRIRGNPRQRYSLFTSRAVSLSASPPP